MLFLLHFILINRFLVGVIVNAVHISEFFEFLEVINLDTFRFRQILDVHRGEGRIKMEGYLPRHTLRSQYIA